MLNRGVDWVNGSPFIVILMGSIMPGRIDWAIVASCRASSLLEYTFDASTRLAGRIKRLSSLNLMDVGTMSKEPCHATLKAVRIEL